MTTLTLKRAGKPKATEPAVSDSAMAAVTPPNPDTAPSLAVLKPVTKQAQLIALLVRDEGATLDQIIAATGWLPHTTRAALTGLKKKGYTISSDKLDGLRTYRGVSPEAA